LDALPPAAAHVARIYGAAWRVRHYARGGHMRTLQRAERAQAIRLLGLTVREAFNASDDFEPLLIAVFNGLNPRGDDPPF
jgi:hypothetical protein